MQGQFFRKVRWGGQRFSVGLMKVFMGLPEDCGLQDLSSYQGPLPQKARWRCFVLNTILESNGCNAITICQLCDILRFH